MEAAAERPQSWTFVAAKAAEPAQANSQPRFVLIPALALCAPARRRQYSPYAERLRRRVLHADKAALLRIRVSCLPSDAMRRQLRRYSQPSLQRHGTWRTQGIRSPCSRIRPGQGTTADAGSPRNTRIVAPPSALGSVGNRRREQQIVWFCRMLDVHSCIES